MKLLTETTPIEMLGPDKKSLHTQVNTDEYTSPKDLDIPFIDEDSDDDKYSSSTSDESITASSSQDRKENEVQISLNLPIMSGRTMVYSKSETEILTSLLEHYRELNLFGMRFTWLCIHKLYRVVLVACNTFITEPIYRLCLMTLFLIIVTVLNSIVKPYNDNKANLAASLSYAANLCLAVLNIVRSVMITFQCKSNSSFQATVLWYFNLTENALLSYIPCMVLGALFVYTVVQKCGQKIRMIKLRELYESCLVDPCISPFLLLLHKDVIHLEYAFTSGICLMVWISNETITMYTIQCQIMLKSSCHYPSPKRTFLT